METDLMENNIEWLTGEKTASLSFTNRKYITKIKKLREKYPEEFSNYYENKDGSIFATIPLSWVKINKPRQMSEESKQAAAERLKNIRERN